MKNKIHNHILHNFRFLEKLSFNLNIKTTKPMLEGDIADKEIYYSNNFIKIKLWFAKFVNGSLLTITVFKLAENKCFSFDEYLSTKSIGDYRSIKNESDIDYINRIAELFQKESKAELKDILEGRKWIDIPKDYSRIR